MSLSEENRRACVHIEFDGCTGCAMASVAPPVKSLVIEWRYAPNLAIYSKMDQIGMFFAEAYPEWKRSGLTLEIKSKKFRRRFYMSYERSFFQVMDPADDVSVEIERAIQLFDQLGEQVGISTLRRLGFRQWAAFPRIEPFKEVARTCSAKFQPQTKELNDIMRGTVNDLSFIVDVAMSEGWKYLMRLGPMTKSEWHDAVPTEEIQFESPEALQAFKDGIPETLLFIDIDASKQDLTVGDYKMLIGSIRDATHRMMLDLNRYAGG